jgi:hypothetical protein
VPKSVDYLLLAESYIEVRRLNDCKLILCAGLNKFENNVEILYRLVLFYFDRNEMKLVELYIDDLKKSYTNDPSLKRAIKDFYLGIMLEK